MIKAALLVLSFTGVLAQDLDPNRAKSPLHERNRPRPKLARAEKDEVKVALEGICTRNYCIGKKFSCLDKLGDCLDECGPGFHKSREAGEGCVLACYQAYDKCVEGAHKAPKHTCHDFAYDACAEVKAKTKRPAWILLIPATFDDSGHTKLIYQKTEKPLELCVREPQDDKSLDEACFPGKFEKDERGRDVPILPNDVKEKLALGYHPEDIFAVHCEKDFFEVRGEPHWKECGGVKSAKDIPKELFPDKPYADDLVCCNAKADFGGAWTIERLPDCQKNKRHFLPGTIGSRPYPKDFAKRCEEAAAWFKDYKGVRAVMKECKQAVRDFQTLYGQMAGVLLRRRNCLSQLRGLYAMLVHRREALFDSCSLWPLAFQEARPQLQLFEWIRLGIDSPSLLKLCPKE